MAQITETGGLNIETVVYADLYVTEVRFSLKMFGKKKKGKKIFPFES